MNSILIILKDSIDLNKDKLFQYYNVSFRLVRLVYLKSIWFLDFRLIMNISNLTFNFTDPVKVYSGVNNKMIDNWFLDLFKLPSVKSVI